MNTDQSLQKLLQFISGPEAPARIRAIEAVYGQEKRLKKTTSRSYRSLLNNLAEMVRTGRLSADKSTYEDIEKAITALDAHHNTIRNYRAGLRRLAGWLGERDLGQVELDGRQILEGRETLIRPGTPGGGANAAADRPHLKVVPPIAGTVAQPDFVGYGQDGTPTTIIEVKNPLPSDLALLRGVTEWGHLVEQIQQKVIPAIAEDMNALVVQLVQAERARAEEATRALGVALQERDAARQEADAAKKATTSGILVELAKDQEIAKMTAQIAERDAHIRELEATVTLLRRENDDVQEQYRSAATALNTSSHSRQSGASTEEAADLRRALQEAREAEEKARKTMEAMSRETVQLREQNASAQAELTKLQRRISRLERDNAEYLGRLQAAHWASQAQGKLQDLGLPAEIVDRLAGAGGEVTIGDLAAVLISLQGGAANGQGD